MTVSTVCGMCFPVNTNVGGFNVRVMIQRCFDNDAASKAGHAGLSSGCCRGAIATDVGELRVWGFPLERQK